MFTSTQKKGGILKPFKVASSLRFFSRTVAQRAKLHAALSRPSVDEYINDVVVWCKAHKKKRWVVKRVVPQTWLLRHVSFLSFFSLSFFLKNKSNEMTGSSYWTGAWDRSALSVCVGDHDDWEVKRKGLSPPRPTWLYFFVNKIIINKRPCAFSPSMQLSRKKWIGLLRCPLFFFLQKCPEGVFDSKIPMCGNFFLLPCCPLTTNNRMTRKPLLLDSGRKCNIFIFKKSVILKIVTHQQSHVEVWISRQIQAR